MAARSSKKSQADLIKLVKAAGWQEDEKTSREWRWFDPRMPGVFYRLRDAVDLLQAKSNAVTYQDLGRKEAANGQKG